MAVDLQPSGDWLAALHSDPPAFNEKKSHELWSTNGLKLHVSLDPLKCTFLGALFFCTFFSTGWNIQ